MNVLITGVLGYIGSWMVEEAIRRQHRVVGLDAGFYRETLLLAPPPMNAPLIEKDVRDVTADDLQGIDAVIHLAELSNDPLGQLDPALTRRINFEGSVRLARLAKASGVSRFLYSSSCSVYGIGVDDEIKSEESPIAPQTEYARCKVMVEQAVSELADESFSPLFLRNATAYGASPAMRFDLVLNNLAGMAYTTRRICLTSDGTPWRPLVHVRDICAAFMAALETPRERWHNRVLNVGSTAENFRVREIANLVAQTFPDCELTLGRHDPDTRSYRVSAERIRDVLPSFRPTRTAKDGVRELRETFDAVGLTRAMFEHPMFTRLARLRDLLASGRLDADLRWRHIKAPSLEPPQ